MFWASQVAVSFRLSPFGSTLVAVGRPSQALSNTVRVVEELICDAEIPATPVGAWSSVVDVVARP